MVSQLSDWREQAIYYGIRESNNNPAMAIKLAEDKYRSLIGRELSLGEVHDLNSLVEKTIEKTKTEHFQRQANAYQNARQK